MIMFMLVVMVVFFVLSLNPRNKALKYKKTVLRKKPIDLYDMNNIEDLVKKETK